MDMSVLRPSFKIYRENTTDDTHIFAPPPGRSWILLSGSVYNQNRGAIALATVGDGSSPTTAFIFPTNIATGAARYANAFPGLVYPTIINPGMIVQLTDAAHVAADVQRFSIMVYEVYI